MYMYRNDLEVVSIFTKPYEFVIDIGFLMTTME
jgi:hypothetical protein